MFITLICLLLLVTMAVYAFMQRPEFGKKPSSAQVEAFRKSDNYLGGSFQNLSVTPSLAKDANMVSVLYRFFFKKNPRKKPHGVLPSEKTDLKSLRPDENVIIWFGHSSYFLQLDGKKFLVDPVFSGAASPIPSTTRSFIGSDVYTAEDMPDIDVLFITHDHWDHLDYDTVLKLKPKIKQVATGLGTGNHLRAWGYEPTAILELDWWEHGYLTSGFKVHATPARHFSGRGSKRNGTLWTSFVLETPSRKIYLGGDSGYDTHFAEIGEKLGPFDLAILECGQYNADWRYIHMMPGQWSAAARDLRAQAVLPVHWAKFALALHDWDEPIETITTEFESGTIPLWTPMIGEKVDFDNRFPFAHWWKGL